MTIPVLVQKWEESDEGWVSFDGYSLHASHADHEQYIKDYWASMPNHTPKIYSRPCGQPILMDISGSLEEMVKASQNGIRTYERVFGE